MTDSSSGDSHIIDALDSYINNFKYLDIRALLQPVPREALAALTVRLQSQNSLDVATCACVQGLRSYSSASYNLHRSATRSLTNSRIPVATHPMANDFIRVPIGRGWSLPLRKTCFNMR